MNQELTIYKQLILEVVDRCEREKIPCIISDETAVRLQIQEEKGSHTFGAYYIVVLSDDMDRLIDSFENDMPKNRAVESMRNNDYYMDYSFRYINTETTAIFKAETAKNIAPCAGVYIIPLRKRITGIKRAVYIRLERWQLECGRTLYKKFKKAYKLGNDENGEFFNYRSRRGRCRRDDVTDPYKLDINGTEYPVSSPELMHRKYHYGMPVCTILPNNENRDIQIEKASNNGLAKALVKNALKRTKKVIVSKMSPANKDFGIVKCVNSRDKLKEAYMPKKALLMELAARNDYYRLTRELRKYHEQTYKYYKSAKMTIYFDRDIYEIYKKTWSRIDKAWVEGLDRLIPDLWKKEVNSNESR